MRFPMRTAKKQNLRELVLAMIAYTVVILTVFPLVETTDDRMMRALIALAPVIPVLFVVRAFIRQILGSDELMRRLHLEALSISAGIVSVASLMGGFLAAAKVIELDGSILFWVFPALAATFGLVHKLAVRRYALS